MPKYSIKQSLFDNGQLAYAEHQIKKVTFKRLLEEINKVKKLYKSYSLNFRPKQGRLSGEFKADGLLLILETEEI